ncbi:MAG: hypothetical protein WDM92_14935 [Caulobacteraceae bacterium]
MLLPSPPRRAGPGRSVRPGRRRRALLLPQVRALGDLDEGEPPFEPGDVALDLPAAISPYRRRFELARLVAAHAPALGRPLDAAGALELADALAAFLDSAELEEVPRASGWSGCAGWSTETWPSTGASPPTSWPWP